PDHAGALYEMGRSRISQNRPEEGLALIDRLLKADPDHTQAHYQRGMALRRLGRMEEAKEAFAAFQKLDREYREGRKVIERKILAPKTKP
ncbi:MAG: tetratricopeptide repeat protein, partial [Acidobacteria bacterium]|nr:tetratricopeptide repeat protein [Acidobacteriota bacterium]